jgi:hypothetical protein
MVAVAIALNCVHIGAHAEQGADAKKPAQDQGAASSAPVIDKVDVKPGDRWSYQVVDDITGETKATTVHTLTEIRDKSYSVQSAFTAFGQSVATTSLQVFDDNWNLLEDTAWTRKPADPVTGIRLPLKVGAQWKTHFTSVRKTPPETQFQTDANIRVVGYEPVILKFNKTYDAFKLEINEALTNSAATSTAAPPSVVTIKVTMWYAPSVNRYVKRITEMRVNDRLQSRSIELLTAYARRHDDE